MSEFERRSKANIILNTLEESNYDGDLAVRELKDRIRKLRKLARDIEVGKVDYMAVQHSMFTVASKSFVVHRYENRVKELEYCIFILNSIRDAALDERYGDFRLKYFQEKLFRGFVKRFKKAVEEIRRVEARKFGGPLNRFLI